MEITITDIQRLKIEPGEILVVHIDFHATPEAQEKFGKSLEQMFLNAGYDKPPEILILEKSVTLEVIKGGDQCEECAGYGWDELPGVEGRRVCSKCKGTGVKL